MRNWGVEKVIVPGRVDVRQSRVERKKSNAEFAESQRSEGRRLGGKGRILRALSAAALRHTRDGRAVRYARIGGSEQGVIVVRSVACV